METKTIELVDSDHETVVDPSETEPVDVHDYVRQFPADQRSQILRRFEELAIEGLESGPMIEMDEVFWERLKEEFEAKFGPAE